MGSISSRLDRTSLLHQADRARDLQGTPLSTDWLQQQLDPTNTSKLGSKQNHNYTVLTLFYSENTG